MDAETKKVLKQAHGAITALRDELSRFATRLKVGDAGWPKPVMRDGKAAMDVIETLIK